MNGLVVGADPGPTPGVVVLRLAEGQRPANPAIFQCDSGSVTWLVEQIFTGDTTADRTPYGVQILGLERFVVGPRAFRSATPRAGQRTREMIGELLALGTRIGVQVVQRSACEVMPWATDIRLNRAGLLEPTKGMPHARAAARHALYAAMHAGLVSDPLSKNSPFAREQRSA